ncbi:MAG: phosphate ABC transporter permease PstA [Spirochaetia bacterium]|nr:phosphate ABC transporter permease PstA [Spirochaetia bacterium]
MNDFGSTKEVESLIHSRRRTDLIWKVVFIIGTCMAILFLVLLLSSIINSVFGYAALRYSVDPVELVYGKESVKDFTREELIDSMNSHLSSGIMRRVLSEKSLEEHSNKELVSIIEEFIVEPKVLRTWTLTESLFSRPAIEEFVQKEEGAYLSFRSWLSPQFLVTEQSSDPYKAGIRTAILGSLWIMLITFGFAFPIGVAAAIYLQEYAVDNRLNRILQLNIFNLSAVPSIIYGLLGLAIFVRAMEPVTSGAVFSSLATDGTANGRTILSGGLTLGLLILPIIIINTQEALKAIPDSLRMSAYGVGATKWQTIWHHLLPVSIDRILTGTILALSRALGETAPLVVIGASTFIAVDPSGLFSKFTTLPIQIYQWSSRPQGAYRNIAAAAIIALLVLLMLLNGTAIYLRNRVTKKKSLE